MRFHCMLQWWELAISLENPNQRGAACCRVAGANQCEWCKWSKALDFITRTWNRLPYFLVSQHNICPSLVSSGKACFALKDYTWVHIIMSLVAYTDMHLFFPLRFCIKKWCWGKKQWLGLYWLSIGNDAVGFRSMRTILRKAMCNWTPVMSAMILFSSR